MVGRWVRALLVATLLAVTGLALPRTAAAAGDLLEVELTAVSTPTLNLSDPTQVVELSGTLTNVSTEPIRYVNVHFWRLSTALTTPAQLDAAVAEVPLGARLVDEAAGNLHILTREDEFAPGQRADFQVRATVAQLTTGQYAFPRDDAAYLLGVQVRGIPASGGNQVVGEDQVVVAATTTQPEVSSVVELTAPPSWLPTGDFLDDSLSDQLSGRLDTLLTSAERDGAVAAVDPALLEAVTRMADEHVVAGVGRPGSGVALRWADRVAALAEADRVWRLPYGDPDLVRARATERLEQVWAAADAATPAPWRDLPLAAIVGAGADAGLVAALTGADTVVVVGADGATAGTPAVLGTGSSATVAALPDGVRAGRMVADALVADAPPLRLVTTEAEAALDAAADDALRRIRPAAPEDSTVTWPAAAATEPWPALAEALDEAGDTAEFRRELMGAEEPADLTRLTALAFSSAFRAEADAVTYVAATTPARVDASRITLKAAQSFVMGSRTNTFPATITNGLGIPIQVRIEFASDAPQRIRVPAVGPVTVAPGESATVDITPEATANGVTIVRAQLTTIDGTPLRAPVPIEITATDFGRVGWIIIVVSGAVVVGGTALRIRAVQRERALKENRESSQ